MDICASVHTDTHDYESMSTSQTLSTTSVVDKDPPADTRGTNAVRVETLVRKAESLSYVTDLKITADDAASGLAVRQSLMCTLQTLSMKREDTSLLVGGRSRVSAATPIVTPIFSTLISTLILSDAPVANNSDLQMNSSWIPSHSPRTPWSPASCATKKRYARSFMQY